MSYPAEATKTGLEGKVTVVVDIDETGKVTKVSEAIGPDWVCPNNNRPDVVAMRLIAQNAAEKAVFVPAKKDDKSIASKTSLEFNFKTPSPKKPTEDGSSPIGVKLTPAARVFDLKENPEPSTSPIDTKTVSGGVIRGLISLPKPIYPAAARALKAGGLVEVQVLIDTNGTVFKAKSISGHPLLRAASRDAACRARSLPTLLSGEPVMVTGIVSYNFNF